MIRRCPDPIEESLAAAAFGSPSDRSRAWRRWSPRHGTDTPSARRPEHRAHRLARTYLSVSTPAGLGGSVRRHSSAPSSKPLGVVDAQASLRHELFQISINQGEMEIPADAERDDFIGEAYCPEKPQTAAAIPPLYPRFAACLQHFQAALIQNGETNRLRSPGSSTRQGALGLLSTLLSISVEYEGDGMESARQRGNPTKPRSCPLFIWMKCGLGDLVALPGIEPGF
jgi:hypothetical protein